MLVRLLSAKCTFPSKQKRKKTSKNASQKNIRNRKKENPQNWPQPTPICISVIIYNKNSKAIQKPKTVTKNEKLKKNSFTVEMSK